LPYECGKVTGIGGLGGFFHTELWRGILQFAFVYVGDGRSWSLGIVRGVKIMQRLGALAVRKLDALAVLKNAGVATDDPEANFIADIMAVTGCNAKEATIALLLHCLVHPRSASGLEGVSV
jgi:hypothetical protein